MSLQDWARTRAGDHGATLAAVRRLDALEPSDTGRGLAVPFPVKAATYRDDHTNREINRAIEAAPIERIPLDRVVTAQHSVQRDRVAQYIRNPDRVAPGTRSSKHGGLVDLPIVFRGDGEVLHLHDGNHRLTAAKLRGETEALARVAQIA